MKPGYLILRMEKHKSVASLASSHLSPDRQAKHIDTTRTYLNTVLKGTSIVDDVRERISASGARSRPDSVLLNEFIVAATPGRFVNDPNDLHTRTFFRDVLRFFEDRYGEENIVYAVVQYDEGNPHMHIGKVPIHAKTIKTGRGGKAVKEVVSLDSKHFFGSPAKLSKLQTDFAKAIGPSYNLRRGIEGSEATHESIHKFYGLVNQVDEATKAIEEDFKPIYAEDLLQNITPTPSGMVQLDQVKRVLEQEIYQINSAKRNLAHYHSSKLAETALDALNAAGGKIVTADQQELHDLKAHLRDQHDLAYDHNTNQTVNLADQRQDKLDRSLSRALILSSSMTKLKDDLERKGITFEADQQQKKIKFAVDGKPTESKQFSYQAIRDRVTAMAIANIDYEFRKALETWKKGPLTDERFVDAVRATGLSFHPLNDEKKGATLQTHTQIGLIFQDETEKWRKVQPFSIRDLRTEIEIQQRQQQEQPKTVEQQQDQRKPRKYTPS